MILIIVNLDFDSMVLLSNSLYGLGSSMLIIAAIRLRIVRKDIVRPTKLCGDAPVIFMILTLMPPLALMGFVTVWSYTTIISGTLTSVFILIGFIYGYHADFSHFRTE